MELDKIIIWGHKLHSHTHSYIHNSFTKCFSHLGYKTYWFEDLPENTSKIDFNNSLFLTCGGYCKYMPILNSSFYLLHNVDNPYTNLKLTNNNYMNFQVYTHDCIDRDIPCQELPFHYYTNNNDIHTIYFPWATDLLPEEIENNILNIDNIIKVRKEEINFIGMPTDEWGIVSNLCKDSPIQYIQHGGTFDSNSTKNRSIKENMELIQSSIVAPAIQTKWQVEKGYIPCRIFKNISYGKMGLTNSITVNKLFNNKLIYSDNIQELLKKGMDFEYNITQNKDIVIELMNNVKNNHTYVNRCNFILNYLSKNCNINIIKC